MRILVSCIPYDGGKSGISVYCREVVRALAARGHELTLLVEPGDAQGREGLAPSCPAAQVNGREGLAPSCPAAAANLAQPPCGDAQGREGLAPSCPAGPANLAQPPCGVARRIAAPRWARRPVMSMLWHLLCLPFWMRRHRREFDGFFICAANRRACAWYPLPTVATIHDLANFHIPGKYSRSRMFYLAHVLPFFARRAQHLVAISEATRADMEKYWGCRPGSITVLYDGLSPAAPANLAQPPCGVARASAKGSILYISRIEHPGKNHARLIEAYGRLPRAVAEAHPLVLVGSDWKDAGAVHEAAARSPYAGQIRFTGFAAGEALERLWGEAGFYVFPSLFEGFGLSLAEAMARGVPCACSNNGSLGEIGEGVAITFDPMDVGSMAAAISELLAEAPEARAARVARGLERAARFSWDDHAAGVARLLSGTGG